MSASEGRDLERPGNGPQPPGDPTRPLAAAGPYGALPGTDDRTHEVREEMSTAAHPDDEWGGQRPAQPSDSWAQPAPGPAVQRVADPWMESVGDPWMDVTPGVQPLTASSPPPGRGRRSLAGVGLFAAGAVAGALLTGVYTGWGSSSSNSALAAQNGQAQGAQPGAPAPSSQDPNAQGQQGQPGVGGGQGLGGQGFGGGQGFQGEQRLVGMLTAVSGSKVTVRSGTGSATYTITSNTQILRDGAPAMARDLRVGDLVLVHVFPAANADGVLERLIARSGSTSGGSGSGGTSSDT
ncbi:MAG: hypothetical protein ACXV0U_01555 [Kineosporiaceae bacterium]